ncbi:hypothetical protein LX36DRAFT_749370 [Colletotrichum falcatum]|nr:hypothetical protein LX36DRAFT_749370 [Colletotrichum falcatum]
MTDIATGTDIGHTEDAAAGIATIIKAVLAPEQAWIPPFVGVNTLNTSFLCGCNKDETKGERAGGRLWWSPLSVVIGRVFTLGQY